MPQMCNIKCYQIKAPPSPDPSFPCPPKQQQQQQTNNNQKQQQQQNWQSKLGPVSPFRYPCDIQIWCSHQNWHESLFLLEVVENVQSNHPKCNWQKSRPVNCFWFIVCFFFRIISCRYATERHSHRIATDSSSSFDTDWLPNKTLFT